MIFILFEEHQTCFMDRLMNEPYMFSITKLKNYNKCSDIKHYRLNEIKHDYYVSSIASLDES